MRGNGRADRPFGSGRELGLQPSMDGDSSSSIKLEKEQILNVRISMENCEQHELRNVNCVTTKKGT